MPPWSSAWVAPRWQYLRPGSLYVGASLFGHPAPPASQPTIPMDGHPLLTVIPDPDPDPSSTSPPDD